MEKSSPSSSYFIPDADSVTLKPLQNSASSDTISDLEARIRRLEVSLATLQDQSLLEERLAKRLQTQMENRLQQQVQSVATLEVVDKNSAKAYATKTPVGEILTPSQVEDVVEVPGLNPLKAGIWFFSEVLPELRAMACMFFDPRYKMGFWNKGIPAGIFLLMMLSQYWVPFASIPVLGGLIEILVLLALGYLLIKLLVAEARRYRQLAPGLPKSLRLDPD